MAASGVGRGGGLAPSHRQASPGCVARAPSSSADRPQSPLRHPAVSGRVFAAPRQGRLCPSGTPRPPPQLRLDGPFSGLNDSHSLAFWTARACRLLGPRNYRLPERGAGCHPSPPGAGGLTSAPVARGPRRTSRLARRDPSRPSTGAARQAGRESALPGPGFGGLTGTAAGTPARGERPAPGAHGARSPRSPAV